MGKFLTDGMPDLATSDIVSMIVNSYHDMRIDTTSSDRRYLLPFDGTSVMIITIILC